MIIINCLLYNYLHTLSKYFKSNYLYTYLFTFWIFIIIIIMHLFYSSSCIYIRAYNIEFIINHSSLFYSIFLYLFQLLVFESWNNVLLNTIDRIDATRIPVSLKSIEILTAASISFLLRVFNSRIAHWTLT